MDEAQFDEFYTSSFARITGQLYAMIGDRDEAQDCVQEAFVRAWTHRRRLARADHPDAWVRTTAYRLVVSRWRRKKLAARPADRALSPAVHAESEDADRVALVTALRSLPDAQRQALVLHRGLVVTPLDPARVRRLGDRRRARRREAYTVAVAAAVAAAIVPVAVLEGRDDAAPPMPTHTGSPVPTPTGTPSPGPARVVSFPGYGIAVKAESDTSKLQGTSAEFKAFIAGVWQQNAAHCRAAEIDVKKYSSAGYALGSVGGCGGYVALWSIQNGTWKEALGTQDELVCGDLTRFGVPDGFVECYGPKAVLGPDSDAGVRLGMSIDEVRAAGGSVSPPATDGTDYCRTVNPNGFPDRAGPDGSTQAVGYLSVQPDRGVVALFAQKDQVTPRGIRTGDGLETFRKAYPDATKTGFGWYRVDIDGTSHYRFDIDQRGVIRSISMELDGPQGCYE